MTAPSNAAPLSRPAWDEPPAVGPVPLWFAFLGGPAAWTAHLLGSYPLVNVACRLGTTTPLNLLTAGTALAAAAAGGVGWWAYRRVKRAGPAVGNVAMRVRFMAFCGMMLGAFFTFVVLIQGLPPVLQDPCLPAP